MVSRNVLVFPLTPASCCFMISWRSNLNPNRFSVIGSSTIRTATAETRERDRREKKEPFPAMPEKIRERNDSSHHFREVLTISATEVCQILCGHKARRDQVIE
ncbi:hypothetical protein CDAR_236931 [Caerostris darwini]|uniref:Secreted protein n=1 Tax=Caerostris darwini TaxID=1538125 RepID=A0AAV4W283_9ARAC|nr:hypothetical protein CDAR_236931 [Caerostris darwini]